MGRSVLIVGAGWLGSAAARQLADSGDSVVATTRSGEPRVGVVPHPRVRYAPFDAARDGAARLAELVRGVQAVVVCWAPGGRGVDRHRHYVGGAETVIEACASAALDRLVYTSSTSALPALDAELDEGCATWPQAERGQIQRRAEEVIAAGAAGQSLPYVTLRLAGLYGPGRELDRVYRWEEGQTLAGDGAAPTNLVHRDDVCAAIAASLELPADSSGLVQICDDDHAPRRECFAHVARQQGRAAPGWEEPPGPPRGKRVANRRMKELLGVELCYPRHSGDEVVGSVSGEIPPVGVRET